jgi:type I restriction enzyme M protein
MSLPDRKAEALVSADDTKTTAVVVGQGKLLDYVDGVTQRNETPEEYVRQEISKSLVREYEYPRDRIAVEFILRVGSRKPRADLVIFHDERKQQDNAFVIVECKSEKVKSTDRKEGVGQLHSYMSSCPNSEFGMWTNGLERFCFRRVVNKGKVTFQPVPDIPAMGMSEDFFERPRFDQLKAASSDALLFAFRRCHNYIAGNQGLQKPEAFWELLKVIFCKIHDERTSDVTEFYATSSERLGLNGNMKVRTRLERLFDEVKSDYPTIFAAGETMELNPPVLAYVVSQLQMYSLLESDVDVKGRAYEEIVGANLRGDRGEFFTPRNICKMAVHMLEPREDQIILDPACGTGGFLITAMNFVIESIRDAEIRKWGGNIERAENSIRQRVQRYASSHIVGMDLNPNLVKATKMNMVMNNDGSGGLYQANSLRPPATWEDNLRSRGLIGTVDLIVTNPPFGSKIPIDEPSILEQYDLGHNWSLDESNTWIRSEALQKTQPPEILFIERCVRLLKPGSGRMAIVLPDGILGSPGQGYVRQWILQNTRVLASIDLHPDTFQPHVSVQTSVLVLERKSIEQVAREADSGNFEQYDVFMAVANHIGHDKRGNVLYVRDNQGNEIVEELEEQVKEYVEGEPVYKPQVTQRKVIDDNTLQIAQEFAAWLAERD